MELRISGITKESFVDGPGIRYVIFTQGCPHNCRGCHNPQTHSLDGGEIVLVEDIVKDIINNKHIDGVTISGGEPFVQLDAIVYLLKSLKNKNLNIVCYTGYTFEKVLSDSKKRELLNFIDILIDGQFIQEEKDLSLPFRGSRNQRVLDVSKSLKSGRPEAFNFDRW